MNIAMERFEMMINLHKNEAYYLEEMGFDYIKYLSEPYTVEDFIPIFQNYLDTETGVVSVIKDVEKMDKGKFVITIEVEERIINLEKDLGINA